MRPFYVDFEVKSFHHLAYHCHCEVQGSFGCVSVIDRSMITATLVQTVPAGVMQDVRKRSIGQAL
jgi:hypothetical protein